MIVRRISDGSLLLINQTDHCLLSGRLAAHWGNARFAVPRPLFGSDVPFWTVGRIATAMNQLDLPASDIRAIQRDNALLLFPRLRT